MTRRLAFVLAACGTLAFALAACPQTPPPGNVQLGAYLVHATRKAGGTCHLGPSDTVDGGVDGGFDFWARLGADADGGTAYLTVAQPPTAVPQQPRRGTIHDGTLLFTNEEVQNVQTCGCLVKVTETIALKPLAGDADGGTPDGGATDGGVSDGGTADGGTADAGSGPIPGIPPTANLTHVSGSLGYQLVSNGACQPPTDGGTADGGVTGCALPCEFGYDLAGPRQ